jgi:hypothetical protein
VAEGVFLNQNSPSYVNIYNFARIDIGIAVPAWKRPQIWSANLFSEVKIIFFGQN